MADPVNFGILNQAPVAHPVQVFGNPNAAVAQEQLLQQGVNSGTQNFATMQENRRQNALLPGQVAQQGATLAQTQAQTGLLTQQTAGAKIDVALKQRDLTFQQNADAAFTKAKTSGASNEQALDAYQSQLTPEKAEAIQSTRDAHMKQVLDNNATAVSNAAGIVKATQTEISQTQDPAMQQHLLANANRQLDRIDPSHPNIKTVQDLHDYSIATLGTLLNPKVQAQLQFELQKAAVSAEVKQQADITTDSVKTANSNAANAQQMIGVQTAYDSKMTQIQQWNQTHPNAAITTGPGTAAWTQIKQRAVAAGFASKDLDQLEQLQAAHDNLVTTTLSSLRTMPRNEKIIAPFVNALSSPSDTAGAAAIKSRIITYGAQAKIGYADFLAEYKDANNGSVTGAQRQWAKFLANDPSIKNGGLPDPNYVKSSDTYLKYTNKMFNPSENAPDLSNITAEQAAAELQRRGIK